VLLADTPSPRLLWRRLCRQRQLSLPKHAACAAV
jgi:hypothetical protein